MLFIESEHQQALKIAELSGKPVLCVETHLVIPTRCRCLHLDGSPATFQAV
ncbi:hypothetical protein ACWTU6_18605 [Mesorhizobium sp. BHbsci]